jgi:hypothetical protein
MRGSTVLALAAVAALAAGCSSAEPGAGPSSSTGADASAGVDATTDAAPAESGAPADGGDAGSDAADDGPVDAAGDADGGPECAPFGAPGQCITVSACAALGDHTSYAGYCPGPADIECCIVTPSTANNPPTPAGWVLMQQSQLTAAMTTWAVMILDDPTTYPMFSTTIMAFGGATVLARVEWHPPDSNNMTVHRGVTLYEPNG